MVVANASTPGGRGGPRFLPSLPSIVISPPDADRDMIILRWLESGSTLPLVSRLVPDSPLIQARPCCDRHPSALWTVQRVAVEFLGDVILSGGVRPDGTVVALETGVYLCRTVACAIRLGEVTPPPPVSKSNPGEIADWLENRARMGAMAMVADAEHRGAFVGRHHSPLLTEYARQWRRTNGMLAECPALGLTLTDPNTY